MSPPSLTRPNRSAESFFINGRWIQSRLLGYAVEEAYRGFLMERRYPLVVMKLSVPLDEVDVNVHPAKNEVRFLKEGEAFSAVQRAVRRGLVAASPVPGVRLPPAPVSWSNQRSWTNAFALIPPNERQALLEIVSLNRTVGDGSVEVTWAEPFDLIALAASEDAAKMGAIDDAATRRTIWLPRAYRVATAIRAGAVGRS